MPESGVYAIQAGSDDAGKRLDVVIAAQLPECSRAAAANLVRRRNVQVNGQTAKASYRVRPGDRIHVDRPSPPPPFWGPEAIDLDILFEDQSLLVINKPPGLVVHPAPGHSTGTVVNALLHHCPMLTQDTTSGRPGIVHRLDKDTSGTMVIAKTYMALLDLASQFKARSIAKTYLAIVHGMPKAERGQIDFAIGRHPVDRKRMSIHSRRARGALSIWHVRERFGIAALVEVQPATGRTHQIRVHLAAVGHPVVGDLVYGSGPKGGRGRGLLDQAPRQMLHAWRLGFVHPQSHAPMSFEAPLPADMQQLLEQLRKTG
jgi:23S rRNA pseudouridine1911/1915/1917 synthase